LQSGGKLTLDVEAIREVAGAIALAEEAGLADASGGNCAAQETAQELHSPHGELEGNRGFGQADRSVEKATYASSWGESRWVEEGEGLVGKVCRNKQYNELRLPGKDGGGGGGELWTKVANWDWRNGLVRGERVWVKRTWLSADDTDSEYMVIRRMDVNEGVEAEPVAEVVAEPEPVAEVVAAAADAVDTSHVLPQFLKQDTVFPRKPESADEYIARIREQASQWANGLAP